jgi:TolA-binding protein
MVDPKPDDAIEQLADLERRSALQVSSEVERSLSRQRFLARIDAQLEASPARWQGLRWSVPAAVVACAAVLLLFWRSPALTFEVHGAQLSGEYVSAPEAHPAELRFSDASTVVAAAGSRLRVEETTAHGARVLLERGRTSVRVVHVASTAWSFGAGPFEVKVTGTRFELAWDPGRETCELVLQEGSVEVRGPTGSGPVVVRAGQRFEGDAKRRTMQVRELAAPIEDEAEQAPVPARPEPSAAAPVGREPSSAGSPAVERAPRTESWAARIAKGMFKEIVSEAEARGIPSCLTGCSAADLRALSDAARYTGNSALAEQALSALRQRFPGAQGSEAAFLLGRLHEKRGTSSTAQTFYEAYLREAPQGAFAAEALAGKLRTVNATQGRAAAQPIAREYLKRFPKGVHVSTAREILGEP